MPEEPLHRDRSQAVAWVLANTEDKVFRDPLSDTRTRVAHDGSVYQLGISNDGTWFWSRCREVF
jgi:hypothetical protein